MKIRLLASLMAATLAVAVLPAVSAEAQSQTPPPAPAKPQDPKPEPKPDAKPATAASLAGKWTVSVETQQGAMESSLELKADPKDASKVTGTLVSQMGEAAIAGEVVDGKLTFSITFDGGGGSMSVTFVGTLQKDGSLAGTFNFGQGEMPWTAVRVKG
jgi:hypothetical protein